MNGPLPSFLRPRVLVDAIDSSFAGPNQITAAVPPSGALLAAVTFLLAGGSTLAMRCLGGVFRRVLCGGRLALGSVFRLDFCSRVLLMSGVAHRRCGVGFVGALVGLLFLFFLFWRFLDAAERSQDFFALFFSLPAAGELHGEDLFDDLVELCSARHAKRFELGGHNRKSVTNRAPLVEKGPNFRKGGRLIGLGHQVGDLIERHLFKEVESIDGSIHLAPNKLFLVVQRFFLETDRGFYFGKTEAGL